MFNQKLTQNTYLAAHTTIEPDGCWLWGGWRSKGGYGQFRPSATGKMTLLHRYVWVDTFGPIPLNVNVYHKCANKHCCNPDHLTLDRFQRHLPNRGPTSKIVRGSKHHNSKLDEDDVETIRKALGRGVTQKQIAKDFNVTQATISHIKNQLSWKKNET